MLSKLRITNIQWPLKNCKTNLKVSEVSFKGAINIIQYKYGSFCSGNNSGLSMLISLGMALYGFVWLCMVLYGFVWLCMALHGFVWFCMALYGFAWFCIAF